MRRLPRHAFLIIGLLALAFAGGCSDGASSTVSGKVTLDGEPLKEGLIKFLPADGKSQNADAPIKDGRYTVTLPPGEKRVEISAPKVVGKRKMYDTPDSPTVDDVKELLPARYNTSSDLKLTVKVGPQAQDYDLTSK